ncbi:5'/3'-nucleotidase SurE [Ruminococcus sp. HUN007]|uniref:5'/3'-nucleotidase SurE n=1 Tax=Ruminococcus sp. HUN007 TaxID=1514668 RepID=UPI0005D16DAF|nr:5'/3'-nucleotidase SurE [Ruminococcus sp. HUN007]
MNLTDKERLILITNDDGIEAPGIKKLAETAAGYGQVYVIAPDGQRSAMSHSITCREALRLKEYYLQIDGVKAFACSGTPADCVLVGIKKILPRKPDHVFSGINFGFNISADIQYSGTAGAALEGAFLGIRSAAFSTGTLPCTEVCDRYLAETIEFCLQNAPENDQIWNINFPDCPLGECKGIMKNTRVYTGPFYDDTYTEETSESGEKLYRISTKRIWAAPPDTDLGAITANYVSIGTVSNIR